MQYGAPTMQYGTPTPSLAKPMRHGRINLLGVCGLGFVPWVVFAALFAAASFCRFNYPGVYLVAFAGVFAIIAALINADWEDSERRRSAMVSEGERRNSLMHCIVFMSLVAWVAAFLMGLHNFKHNLFPWYEMKSFETYSDVDPASRQGTEIMDVGKVFFVSTAKLDFSKSMAFKNKDWYCVTPIVNGTKHLAHYDFWAVGTNCCPGDTMKFACGEWLNPNAHAGIRLTKTEDRYSYRLAVQQATAAFKIAAPHPLFFEWVQDPEQVADGWQEQGIYFFVCGITGFFVFNVLFVVGTMVWACSRKHLYT